ncbi:MAG: hypothetical protein UU37_C0008G0008 [Candidatus Gottesmanbacteria bacterium GW2011_GWA2_41_12]|uniref:Toxin-antitoxin system, toxin component, RelE family n=1 Tax=Candidatus Gottesmanbacteria bacterium GW2011_GWA2_41_12 TaxID=1618440 RepID=A0A0G0XKN9_9BACT|nr:MAG: hypothetical protein UU37_C0008G0008 [Candidatus Gottesmanbacteria bacterium GW2011_GWA2_41_12]
MPVFYPSRTAHIVGVQKLAFLAGSGIIAIKLVTPPHDKNVVLGSGQIIVHEIVFPCWELIWMYQRYYSPMELAGKDKLDKFKHEHPDARSQVAAWEAEIEEAAWQTPYDLKRQYPKADIPGKQQAIFDIRGNRYRLWVKITYKLGIVLVKAIGTHKEYEKWEIG